MPAPLLLVDDDLATIAQVKRLLAREGYEMVLATNAADAVIAWGHHLPPLVLISPKVESDRGRIVLEELRSHPDAQLLHVLLLGETIPGFGYPVAPLPLDPETFAQTVNELVQGTSSGADGWQVHVAPSTRTDEFPAYVPDTQDSEPDSWRATRKPSVPGRSDEAETPAPQPQQALFSTPDADPPAPSDSDAPAYAEQQQPDAPPSGDLENALFGDLEAQVAREVEEEAMASVDASLARMPIDQELQDLEDDVRAEAARRRQSAIGSPAVGLPTPDRQPPPPEEDAFAAFDEPAAAAAPDRQPPPFEEDAFAGFDEPAAPAPDRQPLPPEEEALAVSAPRLPDVDTAAEVEREEAVAARVLADSQKARATLARAEQATREAAAALAAEDHRKTEAEITLQLEREAAQYALQAAEALAAQERAERERVERELIDRGTSSEGEAKQLWSEVERLEGELKETIAQLQHKAEAASSLDADLTEAQALLQARSEAAAALELQLAQMRTNAADALHEAHARAAQLEASISATQIERANSTEAAEALALRLAQAREKSTELEGLLATTRAESAATNERLEREKAERMVLEQERTTLEQEREELEKQRSNLEAQLGALNAQSDELSTAAQRAAGDLREAIEEAEQSEARAQESQVEIQKAQAEAAANAQATADAKAEAEAMRVRSVEAEAGLEQLKAEVEKLRQDFTAAHQSQRDLEEALEDARAANLEVRTRADLAENKARVLEEKSVLPLKVPHRAPLSVTKFGTVDLGQLARLVGQVVMARAEIRLELAATGGRRTVWLNRGAVTAAESTFGGESLLDRARRDGLIDARQTAELQMLRSASPAETVVVLKQRGFLREAEVVPLVQRYTEQVALDAFSEPTSEYRLAEESPGNETLAATLPRPTLPLVAEALRRALPVEELLQRLGGSEAVPSTIEGDLDLRALGFADKERRMLGYCDGEANVEDLALASGLKADVAFRAMLVAKLLGLIELKVPPRTTVAPSPQLDVKRLEAKFEQVQDADYFTMLGLGRAAGGDEVLRAWQRLAEEFDPLKYSGHPDAALQQRAQVVYSVLEEAAKALGDDRRRAEYARHLVD
jgi:hypothetical protein